MFTSGDEHYVCADCCREITLAQYRRKVARCDDCEAEALIMGDRFGDADAWLASLRAAPSEE